jgi:type VI secretion system FHA domain protein
MMIDPPAQSAAAISAEQAAPSPDAAPLQSGPNALPPTVSAVDLELMPIREALRRRAASRRVAEPTVRSALSPPMVPAATSMVPDAVGSNATGPGEIDSGAAGIQAEKNAAIEALLRAISIDPAELDPRTLRNLIARLGEGLQAAPALDAFLRAAGIDGTTLDRGTLPVIMAELGGALKGGVSGLVEVLKARIAADGEHEDAQAQPAPGENNLLKAMPNGDAVLGMVARGEATGYLPLDVAVRACLDDVRARETAIMAGVQASLQAILDRFDPHAIERQQEAEGGVLDGLIGRRSAKTRHWEAFVAVYDDVVKNAEAQFQEVFAEEFRRAYREQMRRNRAL